MANTPNLSMTLLEQSQAQKEVTVNEALYRMDALLNSGVIDKDLAAPPSSPAAGALYIVAASPTGAWAGKAKQLTYFDQVWRFIVPKEGLMLWVADEDRRYVYDGANWIAIEALPASGDMLKATYDAANIAQQVVGTTATQTLTNKTLTHCDATTQSAGNNSTKIATTAYVDAAMSSGGASRVCEGRLTLTSATPVTTADVIGASSLYYTPFRGNNISLWNGTAWQTLAFTEITMSLSGLTANLPYDVFAFINTGAVAIERLAWTNGTTRATALALQNGVLVKSGDATRRYLGTFAATAATTTEDSQAKRFVWNYYNRMRRRLYVGDTTDTWTYSTATYRQANGSAANQIDMVIGVQEDVVEAWVQAFATNSTTTFRQVNSAIGLDNTTPITTSANNILIQNPSISGVPSGRFNDFVGIGRHFLTWLERGGGADTQTWSGDNGGTAIQSNISGAIFA
ncbi:MAG: DUF2793 domain-containing protein [Rickettsiales bacterium]